MLVTVHRNY